jgi:hypothetical protein
MNINKEIEQKKKSDEVKNKYYRKNKDRYERGLLSYDELKKIPIEKSNEYLKKELDKKFSTETNFKCYECAKSLLFFNDPVSDDELLKIPNVKKL